MTIEIMQYSLALTISIFIPMSALYMMLCTHESANNDFVDFATRTIANNDPKKVLGNENEYGEVSFYWEPVWLEDIKCYDMRRVLVNFDEDGVYTES